MSMLQGSFGTKRRPAGFLRTAQGRPAKKAEPIVPMINVVFLLLIFFLMSAEIVPPDPFDMQLPTSASATAADPGVTVFLSVTGDVAYGALRGPDALRAAITDAGPDGALNLRADAQAPAAQLAVLLGDLARLGATEVVVLAREGAQ